MSPGSTDWYRASTLSERDSAFGPGEIPAGFDRALAGRRVESWRAESSLVAPDLFALRLEQQRLDEQRFRHLLGSPAPPPEQKPPWLVRLEVAYGEASARPSMPVETGTRELPEAVFLGVLEPLLDHAWDQLLGRLGERAWAFDRAVFAARWAAPLPRQLLSMVLRTLLLELFVSRLEGRLEGDSPEQRFDSFLASVRPPRGALDLWRRYPVLARALSVRLEQWLEVGLELAGRLDADEDLIRRQFGIDGELCELDAGLGDRHDGGRTVASLGFSCGTRVVYKPRSLGLDVVFQQLVRWLGEQGLEPRLRALEVLDRGSHGWVEFVDRLPCRDAAEVSRFYARQGVYLALLYALEATDFHHENVIAAGEHPVLIDLETLFQPFLLGADTSREDFNPVVSTTLRSGLLPRQAWSELGAEGLDLSGLGADGRQMTPSRQLTGVATDQMAFVDGMVEMPVGKHRPILDGAEVPLWDYAPVVLESFAAAYRRLRALRRHFLEPGGWLDRFAGHQTRVVMRPTGLYVRLLHASYHPDHAQDALHRERLFDKLWLDAQKFDFITQLIPHERHDLWQGDVPRFGSRVDSRDLVSSTGFTLRAVLPASGLDFARRRFALLGDDDLERQLSLSALALASKRPPGPAAADAGTGVFGVAIGGAAEPAPPVDPSDLLPAARRIGERLETLAFRDAGWASWFHLRPGPGDGQVLEPVGPDLYAGLGGIALFLAYLAETAGESRFDELARAAFDTGRDRFERQPGCRGALGGYSGLGSWIYVLTCLGVLWRRPELLDEAETVRELVPPLVDADDGLDVISGSAGAIAALLALEAHRPSARNLELAAACGDHLLGRAERQEHGIAWRLPVAERPLAGFGHGAAGGAWALGRLAQATGEARFARAANGALAYERHLFSPRHGNWPDLRHDRRQGEEWAYFHAWCHGAPGIGLSRLDLLGQWPGDEWGRTEREQEVRDAALSTLRGGFGDNHCLCHGDLGNVELLASAGRHLGDAAMIAAADSVTGRILASLEHGEYRTGITSRVELPGLMTGLAGIGHGLLRLADADAVPSVLLLEPPPRPRS